MKLQAPEDNSRSIARRRFLGGAAAVTLPFLAGCTGMTENEFVASPVYMPPENADAIGYQEVVRDARTAVVRGQFSVLNLETTVTSHYAVYEGSSEFDADESQSDEGAQGTVLTVSGLATPKARVLSDDRNPLARLSPQRLLYAEESLWFREHAELGDVDRDWNRNSSGLVTERTELFGGVDVRLTTRAGVLDADGDPSVLFVHYTSFETDDEVVSTFAVRRWNVDDPDKQLIGEDGYLTEGDLATDIVAVKTAFNAFRFE